MSKLRLLPLAFLAAALYGQPSDNAVPNPSVAVSQAVRGIGRVSLGLEPEVQLSWLQPQTPKSQPQLAASARRCAVPLLEAPIPKDESLPIERIHPPVTDHMKTDAGLPVCPVR